MIDFSYNNNNYLQEYIKEIENGNIIVGIELKKMLYKLQNEINATDIKFNTKDADMRIEFIENFCKFTANKFYGKPFKLMLYQKAFITAWYSFKIFDNDLNMWVDLYNEGILLIARKNGKTEFSSALAYADLMLSQAGSNFCVGSNDDKQCDLIYQSVARMKEISDPKEKYLHKNMQQIICKFNNNTLIKMSSKTQNKEGRNLVGVYVDEAHDAKDDILYNSLRTSQSNSDNPKLLVISTDGFVNDGLLDNLLFTYRSILNDEDDSDVGRRKLIWLYTQDSENEIFQDENSWYKSNPGLGVSKKKQYLRERVEECKTDKSKRAFNLCKDFNIKQNTASAWLMREDYVYPQEKWKIEDFKGSLVIAAVDLAETTDLANLKVLFMKPNCNKKYIYSHYFIPESKLEGKQDDGSNYKEWAKQGWLTIMDGNMNNISDIAKFYYNLIIKYKLRPYKLGYDNKFAGPFLDTLKMYGIDELELINQNANTLNAAIRLTESDLQHNLLEFNNNPIDEWCYGNACLKIDNSEKVLIVKQQGRPDKKIDGAVTMAILNETLSRYITEFKENL